MMAVIGHRWTIRIRETTNKFGRVRAIPVIKKIGVISFGWGVA